MKLCNVVLSTEPRGGKGGVATVVPMYIEALSMLGETEFYSTHNGRRAWGKFGPWMRSFFQCLGAIVRHRSGQLIFHLHPGSGFCLIRMLLLAGYLKFLARQRVFVYLHTPYLEQYLARGFWRCVIGSLVRCADRAVVLTEYAHRLLDRYGMSSRSCVIPNPYRCQRNGLTKTDTTRECVLVLTMGRLVEGKGFIETVRAFSQLPPCFRLVIAGEGELLPQLREAIALLGITERVELKGWVVGSMKDELLANVDVFCLPSRVDSFGMSFVEAQCYDLPIVAYRHAPVMEVIRPGAAVFVDTLDEQTLAAAIEDAADMARKGSKGDGPEWVHARFGINRIAELLKNTIGDVLREAG
jgi:glycosyltransferase involved in cell wall biosynthesis